jgi:hypothetical protein
MSFKTELAKVLQNLSGKTVDDRGSATEMLHAFNNHYACLVTFTLATSGATLVVKKGSTVVAAETGANAGKYLLTEGSYKYSVTKAKYTGIIDAALTITNADETTGTKAVSVAALTTCLVTFSTTPAEGVTLVVKQGSTVIAAETGGNAGKYYMPKGTYTYTASAEGYVTETDTEVTISAGDETTGTKTITVALNAVTP